MLRHIWAITRKELQLWLQKPGQWITVFLVPFVFIAVLGRVFGGGGSPTVTVYAVNEDDSREARQAMDLIGDVKHLELQVLPSREEADLRVGKGQRMAAVVVPEGFGEGLTTSEGSAINSFSYSLIAFFRFPLWMYF